MNFDFAPYYEKLVEFGIIPDYIVRQGIRTLNYIRLMNITQPTLELQVKDKMDFIRELKQNPIAIHTEKANEQHYEVPTEFFELSLGKRMKYSGCLYSKGIKTLDQAEEKMLELYCERAQLKDGQSVLDLGCGWGSLTLFLAEKYPNSNITCLSNSNTQREKIEFIAKQKGFNNIKVITGDIKEYEFNSDMKFERILSIEMFEHMKNYGYLLKKISSCLIKDGLLFVHIFCHKDIPYNFVTDEDHSWIAKHFFTGGTMPSLDLFLYFQDDLKIVDHWYVDGKHYSKTCEHWLQKLDNNRELALEHLKQCYGKDYHVWFQRWRIFYLACSETFNYNNGQTWGIGHYLFKK